MTTDINLIKTMTEILTLIILGSLTLITIIHMVRLSKNKVKNDILQKDIDYSWLVLNDPNGVDPDMRENTFWKIYNITQNIDASLKQKQECLLILQECNRLHATEIKDISEDFLKKWKTHPDLNPIQKETNDLL